MSLENVLILIRVNIYGPLKCYFLFQISRRAHTDSVNYNSAILFSQSFSHSSLAYFSFWLFYHSQPPHPHFSTFLLFLFALPSSFPAVLLFSTFSISRTYIVIILYILFPTYFPVYTSNLDKCVRVFSPIHSLSSPLLFISILFYLLY